MHRRKLSLCVHTALALCAGFSAAAATTGSADTTDSTASQADQSPVPTLETVNAEQKPWLFNIETKRAHLLPEVDKTTITVTKKNSVVKLADQPEVIDNNLRALFARLPGVFVSEQQTPSQGNMNYRGIGNP